MKTKKLFPFCSGFLLGILQWIIIPMFIAGKEPWDSKLYIYIISLTVIGVFFGLFKTKSVYLYGISGLYIGQWIICFSGLFTGKIGNLAFSIPVAALIGSLFLLLYTLISFACAFVVNFILSKYSNKEFSSIKQS